MREWPVAVLIPEELGEGVREGRRQEDEEEDLSKAKIATNFP